MTGDKFISFLLIWFSLCMTIAITLSATTNRDSSQNCIVNNVYTSADGNNAVADVEILRQNRVPYNANVVKYCDEAAEECISSFIEKYTPFIGKVKNCYFPSSTHSREGLYLYEPNKSYNDKLVMVYMGFFIASVGVPLLIGIIMMIIAWYREPQ